MNSELSSSTPATQDADARRSSGHEAGHPAGRSTGSQLRQVFVRYKILALLLAVAAIWAFFSVLTDGAFVTPRNVSNLLRQMSITGMLACGMVFVIIAGEIDLSVGSLLGLLGGVAAILDVNRHWPVFSIAAHCAWTSSDSEWLRPFAASSSVFLAMTKPKPGTPSMHLLAEETIAS